MASVRSIALIQVGVFCLHTARLNPQGGATTCILMLQEQHLFFYSLRCTNTHAEYTDLDPGPDVLKSFTEKQIKKEA